MSMSDEEKMKWARLQAKGLDFGRTPTIIKAPPRVSSSDISTRIAASRYLESLNSGEDLHAQFAGAVHDEVTFEQRADESCADFGARVHTHLAIHYNRSKAKKS